MVRKLPCVVMRGGTSKGVFLDPAHLPSDPSARDRFILAIFGSPDRRQIDGLGGADPLTSKVAIVCRSTRPGVDVDYTHGQVAIDKAEVNYLNTCGNLAAAVGPYAVDQGLVAPVEPCTTVRIYNTNTGKFISCRFPVASGRAVTDGDYAIDGVPGFGAPIQVTFCYPAGGVTGHLLPTGSATDRIEIAGKPLAVSVVDCGNLYAFIAATDVGLSGSETPTVIEARADVIERVDTLRAALAEHLLRLGRVGADQGRTLGASFKVALVAPSSLPGVDIVSRILNPGKVHATYAVTGAIAVAAASIVPGSIVHAILRSMPVERIRRVCIGHPRGVIEVEIEYSPSPNGPEIDGVTITRTARRIMDGFVYLPEACTGDVEAAR